MTDDFDKWADDYIRRQYDFYNAETCASIGAPLKAQLHAAWKAGQAAITKPTEAREDIRKLVYEKAYGGTLDEDADGDYLSVIDEVLNVLAAHGLLQDGRKEIKGISAGANGSTNIPDAVNALPSRDKPTREDGSPAHQPGPAPNTAPEAQIPGLAEAISRAEDFYNCGEIAGPHYKALIEAARRELNRQGEK